MAVQSRSSHWPGRICLKSSAVRVAYLDASDTGYGGYIVEFGPLSWRLRCLVYRFSNGKFYDA